MAVSVGQVSRTMYIGLSTDPKPGGPMIDFSARFYEYDTGVTFIWTGSSPSSMGTPAPGQWVEYLPVYPQKVSDPTSQRF